MAAEWCQPCKERGRLSMARHDVALTLMCDECFGGRPTKGVSVALLRTMAPAKEKEAVMAKPVDDATRAQILQDAAGGLSVEEIRRKNHVSWPTAKKIVDGNGHKAAGGGDVSRGARNGGRRGRPAKSANSGSGVTLNATVELCDGIWNALPLERKAALLNRLAEL